ncbi:hypothetical protein Agabi119p4_10909 [Agaricus bisporus var. burnettii]|uniref:DUF221-domain-containing protein n=1 Tax=Agaricus bisporus var. burnettii TaxID=192524 RepID=A0A8H7C1A1_AGABI|nr:hypothetical protein Agabi119p4_10909 [Agaricus bisporus var. burnettii]
MAAAAVLVVALANAVAAADDDRNLPPGSPPLRKFQGPWFTTQLTISATIGITSFLLFSYCRTRWPLVFAPRTKLKGFSPHEAHAHQAFFGWIMPTIRTSEFTVLQIVGLDAAVLLNFFKTAFQLFSVCSLFAITILMPLNWKQNKYPTDDGDEDWPDDQDDWPIFLRPSLYKRPGTLESQNPGSNSTFPGRDWLDLISDADSYLSIHLIFTYLFTILALYFLYKNYRRFIRSRQLFSLELVHSIPARTVLVTDLPKHLQGERTLAEYFENMNLAVESVTVCREVGSLKALLDRRTDALLQLEKAWVDYVGNPSTVEEYDPETNAMPLIDADIEGGGTSKFVVPHKPRPTLRPGWFQPKVDALEYLEKKFKDADDAVKKKRRTGKFRATGSAFVTFEKMSSAQIAIQVTHATNAFQLTTYPAPEPRDIVWANMTSPTSVIRTRDVIVVLLMILLLFFWFIPITGLASLLSYKEIKKAMPWLGVLIDRNEQVRAIVQNSLPSVAMITLNALLPFMLEALTYVQGYRARSWVEYSLLKKYFLFLLINVVFIFLLATTYWQLVRDLANSPAKVPEKLALALQAGSARHFFLSYVILQGIGIMPLQLLNLGVIIPRFFFRLFLTRTPRDFAELNAPPVINYGVVYPQAILMFVITMLYSVQQPLIVIFGAVYFGVGYVVYKYKLLFVFYKPYESQGQAWPITFIRLIWGVVIFLVFMIGIFSLRTYWTLSSLLIPLLMGTVAWSWYIDKKLKPLSKHVSLSSIFEVQRGEETADVMRLRAGHPVTWSQSNLNRRRYAQNDDTLYVAPEDERTDYSQPPMANWYSGVLNTGKRRYGHPALNGVLPEPWLPLKKGQTLVNNDNNNQHTRDNGQTVVLTLRKRYNTLRGRNRTGQESVPPTPHTDNGDAQEIPTDAAAVANPWGDIRPTNRRVQHSAPLHHRLSFDHGSGVIVLPEDGDWLDLHDDDEVDSDEDHHTHEHETNNDGNLDQSIASLASAESTAPTPGPGISSPSRTSRYGTYFHHPERRKQSIPGAFPGR